MSKKISRPSLNYYMLIKSVTLKFESPVFKQTNSTWPMSEISYHRRGKKKEKNYLDKISSPKYRETHR